MGAEALSGQLHDNGLMEKTCVHLHAENVVIELDIANLLVSDVINCYISHNLGYPPSN